MRLNIQLLSDLHLDIHHDAPDIPGTEADIIILAGDITEGTDGIHWALTQAERLQKPVIYLAGNHEYYQQDLDQFDYTLRSLSQDHPWVHFLQMSHYDIREYRILGTTLWTSFDLDGTSNRSMNMWYAHDAMDDYRCIYAGQRRVSTEQIRELHLLQRQWLEESLKQALDEQKKSIVVTHHAPHPNSIASRFQTSRFNSAFASNLTDLMDQPWSPMLWLHGHIHDPADYVVHGTRVVAHPRGYPEERGCADFMSFVIKTSG